MTQRKPLDNPCLSDETIACWVQGFLPSAAQEKTGQHLKSCASCRELVAVCARVAEEQKSGLSPAPAAFTQSAKDLVGAKSGQNLLDVIVSVSGQAVAAVETTGKILFAPWLPALHPLRGADQSAMNTVVIEKIYKRVHIHLEVSGGKSGSYTAALTLRRSRFGKPLPDVRVILYQDRQELESYLTREGRVSFERLTLGLYRLKILGLERKPQYLSLRLRAL